MAALARDAPQATTGLTLCRLIRIAVRRSFGCWRCSRRGGAEACGKPPENLFRVVLAVQLPHIASMCLPPYRPPHTAADNARALVNSGSHSHGAGKAAHEPETLQWPDVPSIREVQLSPACGPSTLSGAAARTVDTRA